MSTTEPALPTSRRPVSASSDAQEESARNRKRSVKEIEQAMAERTARLSTNIDELAARVRPMRITRDGAARIGSKLTTSEGNPRLEVLGATAGAVLVAGVLIWRARRRRR